MRRNFSCRAPAFPAPRSGSALRQTVRGAAPPRRLHKDRRIVRDRKHFTTEDTEENTKSNSVFRIYRFHVLFVFPLCPLWLEFYAAEFFLPRASFSSAS